MLGSVNARSIRNKGPLLSDTIASHAFDFLCLTETHIRTTDSDSFLHSLTPDGSLLIHRPRSTGIGGGVGFFMIHTNIARWIPQIIVPLKMLSNQFQFLAELCSKLLSIVLLGRVLPFLDKFMSFVCFLSFVDCNYVLCSDFNIHVDVPCTDSHKLESLLESCNLTQSVNNTTHLHGHILDLILSPSDQDMYVHVDICEFISDHAVIKCAIDFPSYLL